MRIFATGRDAGKSMMSRAFLRFGRPLELTVKTCAEAEEAVTSVTGRSAAIAYERNGRVVAFLAIIR